MLTVTGILCRLWRCADPSRSRASCGPTTGQSKGSDETFSDDLTVIRGIGIAIQDRLYRSGIKSFTQLAQSSPERVREILGISARGAKIEAWIKEAAGLAKKRS